MIGLGHLHTHYSNVLEEELGNNLASSHVFNYGEFAEKLSQFAEENGEERRALILPTEHYGSQNHFEHYESRGGRKIDSTFEQLQKAGYWVENPGNMIYAESKNGKSRIAIANGAELSIEGLKGHYPIVGLPIDKSFREKDVSWKDARILLEESKLAWNAHPGTAQNSTQASRNAFYDLIMPEDTSAGIGISTGYPPPINSMANNLETGENVSEYAKRNNLLVVPEIDFHAEFRPDGRGVVQMDDEAIYKAQDGEVPVEEYVKGEPLNSTTLQKILESPPGIAFSKHEALGDVLSTNIPLGSKKQRKNVFNWLNKFSIGEDVPFPVTEKQYEKRFSDSLERIRHLS